MTTINEKTIGEMEEKPAIVADAPISPDVSPDSDPDTIYIQLMDEPVAEGTGI